MRKLPHSILKRLNRALRPEYSIVRRGGVRFLLNKYNWIDSRLLGLRAYEKANLEAMQALLHAHGIRRLYDIGANFGYFTVRLAAGGFIDEAHAFEPLTRNYHQLCANILINDLGGRAHPHHLALGNENKTAQAWYNARSTGITTLDVQGGVRKSGDYTASEMVTCTRFDEIFAIPGQAALVKIDVEGLELQVLSGMEKALACGRFVLFIESHAHAAAVEDFLARHGYRRLAVAADDYVFSNF